LATPQNRAQPAQRYSSIPEGFTQTAYAVEIQKQNSDARTDMEPYSPLVLSSSKATSKLDTKDS